MVVRDGDGRRGQHRARVGDQDVDLVLGDELVVERRGSRRVALVVVGHQLDRDFLVEGLYIDAALGVLLLDPDLERAVHGIEIEAKRPDEAYSVPILISAGGSAARTGVAPINRGINPTAQAAAIFLNMVFPREKVRGS